MKSSIPRAICVLAPMLLTSLASIWAAVPSSDTTLEAPHTENIPVITAISAYGKSEADVTGSYQQTPMYCPWDSTQDAWWDNLVSEHLQARLPVVMLSVCGGNTVNPTDMTGPGNMNARNLDKYIAALQRAGAASVLKFGCFAEADAESIYRQYYNLPAGTPYDFSNTDAWNQVWWLRIIKPWFDTVPSSYWYKINGQVPIECWGLNITSLYTNQQGNISQLFNFLATQMQAAYGVSPCFIMGSLNCDTTLASCQYMVGDNEWFSPPSTPYTMTSYKGKVWGGMVAGYINPGYFNPADTNHYMNLNCVIQRNGISGTGTNGDTLKLGLNASVSSNAAFSIIEGWIDVSESTGLDRCVISSAWDYPNQYINTVAGFTDLRTVTQRLQAEACDEYYDTTSGNSGGAFLRSPEDLDVRAITSAPVISCSSENAPYQYAYQAFDGTLGTKWYTPTVPPGWLQYNYGSGNSAVVASYYMTSSDYTQLRDPKDWQLLGSNDGVTWTTLDSRAGEVFAARNQTNQYTFTNSTAYRFFRLNVSANYGGSPNGIALAELKLIRANSSGGGWAVTNTAAGEWIQFNGVNLSAGNYKFPVRYSSTATHTLRLLVDGAALSDVALPSTGGTNTFTTAYLGTKAIRHGAHTVQLYFVDGGVDVDWIFVKKYDPLFNFKSALTNCYLTAESGGNNTMVSNRTAVGSWEKFSMDDQLGAGAVSGGDTLNMQAWDGLYVTSLNNGGAGLALNRRSPGIWENYTIVKLSGTGAIVSGDQVALQCNDGVHYMTVQSNGTVDATGTSIGSAQTFTVGITNQ